MATGILLYSFSINDLAGRGIAETLALMLGSEFKEVTDSKMVLVARGPDYVIAGFRDDVLFMDYLHEYFEETHFIVMLSRHSSAAKIPSLTVHHTGNFGSQALYGGNPRELGIANPLVAYIMLRKLKELVITNELRNIEVSYEATHHGPTSLNKPLTFIEIGSSENEWIRKDLHLLVAQAAYEALRLFRGEIKLSCIPSIGVGGGHYPRKHTKLCIEKSYCYGHIISKRTLDILKPREFEEALNMCFERSMPKPKALIIEKKSVKSAYRKIARDFALTMDLDYIEI